MLSLEIRKAETSTSPCDIWSVSRKVRTKYKNTIARINEGLAEKLFKVFSSWPSNDILSRCSKAIFFIDV